MQFDRTEERRTINFPFRLTKSEAAWIDQEAERLGITRSDLIRKALDLWQETQSKAKGKK